MTEIRVNGQKFDPAPGKYDPRAEGCRCDECPLKGKKVVPPRGPYDAEFVLVGDAPGQNEIQQGRPFVGPSGRMLNELLKDAGIEEKRCWITNAILCRAEVPDTMGAEKYNVQRYLAWIRKENGRRRKEKIKDLLNDPFECCRPRLLKELNHFEVIAFKRGQPSGCVVIPLGNYALKTVTGRSGILKFRGSPLLVNLSLKKETT